MNCGVHAACIKQKDIWNKEKFWNSFKFSIQRFTQIYSDNLMCTKKCRRTKHKTQMFKIKYVRASSRKKYERET